MDAENGDILVRFSWYDSLNEIRRLFSESTKEEGNIFSDIDQSWELVVESYDGKIFIKERDPDDNKIYCSININRQELIKQMGKLLADTETIVGKLTSRFDSDYWTKRI